jgi:hypothetical protein
LGYPTQIAHEFEGAVPSFHPLGQRLGIANKVGTCLSQSYQQF